MASFLWASDYDNAVALLERGNPRAAIPTLERLSRDTPREARVWKALGVAYASLGQYSQAEPAFGKACAIAASLPDACYYHGRALYALNRFPESLAALAKAPQSAWSVQLAIAQAHEANGDAALAEKTFRRALSTCAGRAPNPASALGLFLLRQGRLDEAEKLLRATSTTFPQAADARTQLGRLLLEKNTPAEAITHLEAALQLMPNSAQAHLLLAKALLRTGKPADAQPHFDAAAKLEAAAQGTTQ